MCCAFMFTTGINKSCLLSCVVRNKGRCGITTTWVLYIAKIVSSRPRARLSNQKSSMGLSFENPFRVHNQEATHVKIVTRYRAHGEVEDTNHSCMKDPDGGSCHECQGTEYCGEGGNVGCQSRGVGDGFRSRGRGGFVGTLSDASWKSTT